jgi:hypothetical protein
MWRRVICQKVGNISEKPDASIFKVKYESPSEMFVVLNHIILRDVTEKSNLDGILLALKVKLSLHRPLARGWGSHIFQTFGIQMTVRLSALRAGRFLPPRRFLVLISVRGWVESRAIVRLEGLGKLKKSTSSRTRTGDLPACSLEPQPTTLPRAPKSLSACTGLINMFSRWNMDTGGNRISL